MKGECRQRSPDAVIFLREIPSAPIRRNDRIGPCSRLSAFSTSDAKTRHARALQEQARAVNFLWNYCNELSAKVWERKRRFLSGYEFHPFTKGAGREGLGLYSGAIRAVADEQKACPEDEAVLAFVARRTPLAGRDSV